MKLQKINLIFQAGIVVIVSLACSMSVSQPADKSHFSDLRFCQDVSDDGNCIGQMTRFPAGTTAIWVLFNYKDMTNGDIWGRVWEKDGEIYSEVRDEIWEDDQEGWVAYSLEDPNGMEGELTLSLYLGNDKQGSASCIVENNKLPLQQGSPSFGPVTLSENVTENNFPLGVTTIFDPGTQRVYGIFSYKNLEVGVSYTVEWMVNDIEASREESVWENSGDGIYHVSLYDDEPLPDGDYTLNLYIENQLVRSAIFQVLADNQPTEPESIDIEPDHPQRPAEPEEVVDVAARKYFDMIARSDLDVLREIIRINLENWTRVIVSDDVPCSQDAVACFSYSCDNRSQGTVYIRQESVNNEPDYIVAEYMTHELTHGMEHYLDMKCGCTVEKEYISMVSEIDFLLWSGYEDYAYEKYGKLWDDDGQVRKDLLWDVVKAAYYSDTCPEY